LFNGDGDGVDADTVIGLDDSLQKAMDTPCYVNCPTLKTQTIQKGNECSVDLDFKEPIDGCEYSLLVSGSGLVWMTLTVTRA
jgi:hypothetical protein